MDRLRQKLIAQLRGTDLLLLLFLASVAYPKIYVKLAAIVLYGICCIVRRYKFSIRPVGPLLFYILIAVTGSVGSLLHGSFSDNHYWFGYVMAVALWLMAGTSFLLLKATAGNKSIEAISATLRSFFCINLLFSIAQLIGVCFEAHHPFPYWYEDAAFQFGVSTGDRIKGIFGEASSVNAAICFVALMFFTIRKEWLTSVACMVTIALCTSNAIVLATCLFLIVLFCINKEKIARKYVALSLVAMIGFYSIVSPMNVYYSGDMLHRFWVKLTTPKDPNDPERIRAKKIATYIKEENRTRGLSGWSSFRGDPDQIKAAWLQQEPASFLAASYDPAYASIHRFDTTKTKLYIKNTYRLSVDSSLPAIFKKPVKLFALQQSLKYDLQNPTQFLTGAGIGNLSSRMAVKMTGIGLQGNYPESYTYMSRDFFLYGFHNYLYLFTLPVADHSVLNRPESVYNQLAGEYGAIGLVLFFSLYAWYFFRQVKSKTYRWMIIVTLGIFLLDSWLEMISLTVFFELMMLTMIRKNKTADADQ